MALGRPPRDRRAEILEIAGPLFLEHGYQGTSMSRIASALGGSKGTLYAYFDSKEALFEAYMEDRVRVRGATVFDLPPHADDLHEVLRLLGKRYLNLITDKDPQAVMRLLYHESPRFPEIGRIFYETCILRGRRLLAEYLTRADELGVLRIPDADVAAEHFLALCQSTVEMPVMLCVKTEVSEEEARNAVEAAVSVFLAAYAA
ncbi:TetR/AcrR family transcriptional regulator [Nitratidesulfovibrio sp. SRB-5]|uniref:TetR/AcrR family transcriptional regulator n=1 Tax=Nitratidesulfovibrio sp. SRB-5 TaxID=2872636 RepID=UPI00102758AE|nr:TetR/AcrR family transcriptional regulator [Nitratidesulfovibrio sp. SRB-5]MBZ2170707.1 TetR/AcrR family transcriptional regulator [Nitratidesulfovibrio sp. SRB-5]RXF76923.1 TetR/AcrR family transcriptional regulator [Desulfovibrio sp. DS-1]